MRGLHHWIYLRFYAAAKTARSLHVFPCPGPSWRARSTCWPTTGSAVRTAAAAAAPSCCRLKKVPFGALNVEIDDICAQQFVPELPHDFAQHNVSNVGIWWKCTDACQCIDNWINSFPTYSILIILKYYHILLYTKNKWPSLVLNFSNFNRVTLYQCHPFEYWKFSMNSKNVRRKNFITVFVDFTLPCPIFSVSNNE
jgi:hypothetical protein